MRLSNLTFPTRQIFERSATYPVQIVDTGSIAPHAPTERFAYTVPAGRIAYVSYFSLQMRRATAATTPGFFEIVLNLRNPAGTNVPLGVVRTNDNTVGVQYKDEQNVGMYIEENWTVRATTFDASTGGTVNYWVAVLILEFSR